LETVLDKSDRAIFIIAVEDARFVDCNQRALEYLGYTRDELLEHTVMDIEETLNGYDAWREQADELLHRDRLTRKGKHRTKAEKIKPVKIESERITLQEDDFVLAFVDMRESSEKQKLRLTEKFKHYRRLFQKTPIGQFELDASEAYEKIQVLRQSGVDDFEAYLEADSDRILEFLGMLQLGSVNKTLLGMVDAADESYFKSHFLELFGPEAFEPLKSILIDFTEEKLTAQEEIRITTFEGQEKWLEVNLISVEKEENFYSEVFVSVSDLTRRKRNEEKLSRSEEQFRSIFQQAAVGISYTSPDGTMNHVNQKFCELLGYERDELEGETFQEFTHPEDLEENLEYLERARSGEIDNYSMQKRFVTKDGDTIWTKLTVGVVRNSNDDLKYLVSVIEDISNRIEAENRLRRSEERFRSLFEQAAVGILHVAPDGTLLRTNEKCCELLGYDRSELEGKTFQDFTHPDDLEKDLENLEAIRQGEQEHYSIEKRYYKKNGDVLWVELTVGAVRDESGEPKYYVSVIKDITDRKQAEEELRLSETRFRLISENIDQVIWLKDPESGGFDYMSPVFEDIWGLPVERVLNDSDVWLESVHEEDRSKFADSFLEQQRSDDVRLRYRIIRSDGEIRWLEGRSVPIEDEQGNVVKIAGITEDITEQRKIRREKETFFDLTLDLFAIADFEGNFLEVNQAFIDTLGYSRSELLSQPYLELIHPDDREETRNLLGGLGDGKPVEGFENRYRTKDGGYRWLSWRAQPGEDVVYAVARDVTERREFEERLQTMVEEKETLLKEVHHRVKNNLQIISSLLSMQKRKISHQETLNTLSDSIHRVKTMAAIHEQLYNSNTLASVNFKQYLEDLVQRLLDVQDIDQGQVNVDLSIEPVRLDLDVAIPCGLILNELITNSFEHGSNSDTGDQINIKLFRASSETIKMVVEDNGEGFPEKFTLGSTDSIGMKVVQSLAEYELDGTIDIDNQDGARVSIQIPYSDEDTLPKGS
jgi:PAS domain S-box-containing protein